MKAAESPDVQPLEADADPYACSCRAPPVADEPPRGSQLLQDRAPLTPRPTRSRQLRAVIRVASSFEHANRGSGAGTRWSSRRARVWIGYWGMFGRVKVGFSCFAVSQAFGRPRYWSIWRSGPSDAVSRARRALSRRWSSRSLVCSSCAGRCSMSWTARRARNETLRVAFGLAAGVAPDGFLVGLALLSLFAEVADAQRWCAS